MLTNNKRDDIFVSILSDGMFHRTVTEGTDGAVLRKYKTSTGEEGEKWELQYTELTGKISKINFHEGDYGLQLQVTFEDDGDKPITLSVNAQSNFGEDIMKKLPNVDLNEPVKLVPYAFEDEKTKKPKRGVTIYQNEAKIGNFYYDTKKKKPINGYPAPKIPKVKKGEKVPTSFWKLYFLQANTFLVEDIRKRLKIDTEEVSESDAELDELVEEANKALE